MYKLKNGLPLLACFFLLIFFGVDAASIKNSFGSIQFAQESLGMDGWITIVIFILAFAALITEVKPPEITMLICSSSLVILGVITPKQFLKGFSNEVIMTIAMLCILVRAMEVNGILEVVGRKLLSKSKNFFLEMISMIFPVAAGSAFLNNTPIVLLMTPIVRKWAIKNKKSPSKFLLPLSYAAVLGGACTLIGTSTNLVVYGLVRLQAPEAGFGFFDLSYVAVPCCIAGMTYLIFVGKFFLPDRPDPTSAVSDETREFTAEFTVKKECPLANQKVKDVSIKYFKGDLLVQIERNGQIIDSPNGEFTIFAGDRLVFVGDINQVAQIHTIDGLMSMQDPKFKFDESSSHFAEVVISGESLLIGKTLRQINFRNKYGASVLAIYRQGWRIHGDIRDVPLQAGDTLMMLTGEPWRESTYLSKDFFYIRHHEKLLVFNRWKSAIVLFSLIFMVISVSMGGSILIGSMAAVGVVIGTKCISIREAKRSLILNIFLLIACSFALAQAMIETGVAIYFAKIVLNFVGSDPKIMIATILFVTMFCSELMTNNAAALIVFPIALEIAHLAGYQSVEAIKTIGITVALGASMAFMVPTGYQTHMIVYGPGGYKFTDFNKAGFPLSLMVWLIGSYLISYFWPLV